MKQGINSMIDLFCGGFGSGTKQNRLAIMQFSDRPLIVHYFNDSQAPADLRKKVQSMEDFGGRTCTGDALEEAYDQIFRLDRGQAWPLVSGLHGCSRLLIHEGSHTTR